MRVALVHPHISRSSSLEREVVLLAAGLISHGVDVHCYSDPATRTAEIPGATFHDVSAVSVGRVSNRTRLALPLYAASFAIAATKALRRDRHLYDIIDVRQTAALAGDVVQVDAVIASLQKRWPDETGRMYRAPALRALVAPALRPQIGVDRVIQRYQLRRPRFRRVIAVTEQVRDDLVHVHRVRPDLIDVLPYAIDLERIRAARPSGLRAKLAIRAGQPLILFIGNTFERKGLDALVEALAGVPDAYLVVVGDDDPQAVEGAIERGGLTGRVHFAGGVDDPERFYAEADLFVLPSRTEPWGIPLIEAMAAGVPVISTSIAGAAHVVTSADAGIILLNEEAAALREAICTLLSDPERRRLMGERGQAAAARFGTESHAAAVLEIYRRALDHADTDRY